ncbi:MAG: hypothetical protein J1E56_03230 [Ruminococcus sp.]|nr:hypothetical protein [Ruminococcus sp.]
MENKDYVALNQENTAETENKDFEISERTKRIIKERIKRRNRIRMNFLYKIGFILFVIAITLLIAAMVICLIEDAIDHDSFLAIIFSMISAFLAFLGIIFTCVSKEKPPKKRKIKKIS